MKVAMKVAMVVAFLSVISSTIERAHAGPERVWNFRVLLADR